MLRYDLKYNRAFCKFILEKIGSFDLKLLYVKIYPELKIYVFKKCIKNKAKIDLCQILIYEYTYKVNKTILSLKYY